MFRAQTYPKWAVVYLRLFGASRVTASFMKILFDSHQEIRPKG
jgi:hypothetical protein